MIEFAGGKPCLRRIQVVDVDFPVEGRRRRRRHRGRPGRRLPSSWPEVAGVVVGDWPTTFRTGLLAVAAGLVVSSSQPGLGAASAAVTGILCLQAARRPKADPPAPATSLARVPTD
ncbi:hypothetical protein ACIOD2_10855 [Amycolatopsis sp. NPDC088138]|uniref:hypothetical protein n=1 Tax=Amycolatopsis sp. NPDC088138 TaxID=3363938 RepID=UPI0037FD6E2D